MVIGQDEVYEALKAGKAIEHVTETGERSVWIGFNSIPCRRDSFMAMRFAVGRSGTLEDRGRARDMGVLMRLLTWGGETFSIIDAPRPFEFLYADRSGVEPNKIREADASSEVGGDV